MSQENLSLDPHGDQVGVVKLVSKEGKEFKVDKKCAFISNLIKTSMDTDPTATEVPMNVKSDVLAKVVEYMNYHKGEEPPIIEKPLRSKIMKDVCKDSWDADFIDKMAELSRQPLYDIILAANYMDIKSLLHLGCAKVASLIKGQPLDQIKTILAKGTPKEGKTTEEKKE